MYYLFYGLRQVILFLSTGIYQYVTMGYEARLLGFYGARLLFRLDTEIQGLYQHENLTLMESNTIDQCRKHSD
ncbi:uncharacterized [Tachysurus ichikawai]